jgi:DNA-binding NtrC family response regulator
MRRRNASSDRDSLRDDGVTHKAPPPELSPDGAVLIVISGQAKGRSLRLPSRTGASVRIGKADDNDLVLPDATVSRHHLGIERVDHGLIVRDLGSLNGIRIGGGAVKEAVVGPGAIIGAGSVELLIAVETRNAPIPPSIHDQFGLAVGSSLAMRCIFGVLERAAPTPASVLLLGETGTGKDTLARSIHAASARADGPFEVLDCGAVSSTLIESELFGHERGAFTGAVSSRAGAFERAAGGTLFLDEVGELDLALQPKLLRVLEAREYRRVGGNKTLNADVRIIAATTRNLEADIVEGRFRDDLYFRLAVVMVRVPALRERPEDIPLVASRLLAATDPRAPSLTPSLLAALKAYDWPGNVRELRNTLERAVHLARGSGSNELLLHGFPPERRSHGSGGDDSTAIDLELSYRDARARVVERFEHTYVKRLLERHGGNVSAAARSARMDRTYLIDLVRKHGLDGK